MTAPRKLVDGFRGVFVFLLLYFKLVLADSTDRTYPVIRNILKCRSGCNTMFGIPYFRIIDPITYYTYILVHS